ncbi:MAG: TfoX/Sxy family protein [Lewinellaceae bacterium]|nr:TfoX/Sxy family protein [Lewinellaceae bacterium]
MATDPYLLERMRSVLKSRNVGWSEKRMFGGDCFMVDDKMCFGTYKGGIMARVAPEEADELAQREGAAQMIHGGRPMTGYLFIEPEGYDMEEDLEFWIGKCLEFNPRAKSSKKK